MAEPIGLAASLLALVGLSVKTINYIQAAKGATKERAQLTAEIQFCQVILGGLQDVSDNAGWKQTMEVLIQPGAPLKLLEETLERLVQKLSPKAGIRHRLHALKWPFEEKEVKSILDMIERQKATLSLALDNNSRLLQDIILSQLKSNRAGLDELKEICGGIQQEIGVLALHNKQSRTRQTLQWITKLNFGPRHESLLQLWATNTASWITRDPTFEKWISSPSGTLWCYGGPGTGKSVIAAKISDFLDNAIKTKESNDKLVTLYCDHASQESQTLPELVRSIFQQILADMPTIPTQVHDLRQATREGLSPSLSNLTVVFKSFAANIGTIFVVLDAIDEAAEDVQTGIVDMILGLPFSDIRVLCTSRRTPRFEAIFSTNYQIKITTSDDDIETFVRQQIRHNPRLGQTVGEDVDLENAIVTRVIEKADGMFLMARHHVESLFTTASKAEIRRTLDRLPSKVKDAYKDTMNRILNQPENDAKRARRTLSWIFGARRPLWVEEIRYVLAVLSLCREEGVSFIQRVVEDELPHPSIIISCCQGLLIQESDRILPCHHTVVEYFRETYGQWFPDGQADIALTCTQYLSQRKLQTSISRYFKKLQSDRKKDLSSRYSEYDVWLLNEEVLRRHKLLSYTGTYWGTHLWEAYQHDDLEGILRKNSDSITWWMGLDLSGGLKLHPVVQLVLGVQSSIWTLRSVIAQNGDVNGVQNDGQSILSRAIDQHDPEVISFLLTLSNLDVKAGNGELIQQLGAAVDLGSEDLVQRLLSTITSSYGPQVPREILESLHRIQTKAASVCQDMDRFYQVRTFRVIKNGDTPNLMAFYRTTRGQLLNGQKILRISQMLPRPTEVGTPLGR